jgi:hypothetical protein
MQLSLFVPTSILCSVFYRKESEMSVDVDLQDHQIIRIRQDLTFLQSFSTYVLFLLFFPL